MNAADFWTAIAAMCGVMLVCLAVAALAERKIGEKGWRRMMAPLGGKNENFCSYRSRRSAPHE